MIPLKLSEVTPMGDLSYRIIKNFARVEGKEYKTDTVFTPLLGGWPADWEGRTILALVLLAQSSKREAAYLEDILRILPSKLNDKGYMGKILSEGLFDEQQLSGHNWMVRGLIEYYLWKKDPKIESMIHKMVTNLYKPLKGAYKVYPVLPEERTFEGEAAGNLTGQLIGNWYISTDTGCAYMSMDALTQYYEVFRESWAYDLIVEMIDTFTKIDFLKLSMQTHASLTATRGIIRMFEITGNPAYLKFATEFFHLYTTQGMTENYANYNWFERPHWTEPCAIADSYMVAMGLYKNTGTVKYLETAQRIFFNGLGYAQRSNGGFGCDNCAGAGHSDLHPDRDLYEAFWCCTMRGGEGLARFVQDIVVYKSDEIYINHPVSAKIQIQDGNIEINSDYPFDGDINLSISGINKKSIKLFLPKNISLESVSLLYENKVVKSVIQNSFLVIENPDDGEYRITFNLSLIKEASVNKNNLKNYYSLWHGVLMLGAQNCDDDISVIESELKYSGRGKYKDNGRNILFEPVCNMIDIEKEIAIDDCRTVMFSKTQPESDLKEKGWNISEPDETVFTNKNGVYQDGVLAMNRDTKGTYWVIAGHTYLGGVSVWSGDDINSLEKKYDSGFNFKLDAAGESYNYRNYPDGPRSRGGLWPYGLYIDPKTDEFTCFIHNETGWGAKETSYTAYGQKEGEPDFRHIGVMTSCDYGRSWDFKGWVITANTVSWTDEYKPDGICFQGQTHDIISLGAGDFSLFINEDDGFFYIFYSQIYWSMKDKNVVNDKIYVARSPISEKGMSGTWKKYHRGNFSEPGNGGKETEILKGNVPCVSYNTHLKKFMMTSYNRKSWYAKEGACQIAFSDNLTKWSQPVHLSKKLDFLSKPYFTCIGKTGSISKTGQEFLLFMESNGTDILVSEVRIE